MNQISNEQAALRSVVKQKIRGIEDRGRGELARPSEAGVAGTIDNRVIRKFDLESGESALDPPIRCNGCGALIQISPCRICKMRGRS